SEDDARAIVQGLEGILADWQAGRIQLDPRLEDVHMNVERLLEQRIGEPARRLHTARSRNDQVALDLRLFLRRRTADVRRALALVRCDLAEQHAETVRPGYTHPRRAQAVTLGHDLLAYVEMRARDDQRFADAARRMGQSPLGAGALAGTSLPIAREQTAAEL